MKDKNDRYTEFLTALILLVFYSLSIWLLWGVVMVKAFGLPPLSFIQALALRVLVMSFTPSIKNLIRWKREEQE